MGPQEKIKIVSRHKKRARNYFGTLIPLMNFIQKVEETFWLRLFFNRSSTLSSRQRKKVSDSVGRESVKMPLHACPYTKSQSKELCLITFHTFSQLISHIRTHHPYETTSFCELCKIVFVSAQAKKNPVRRSHFRWLFSSNCNQNQKLSMTKLMPKVSEAPACS